MWFIGVEVEQETSAPPPKQNTESAPAHMSGFRNNMKHLKKTIKQESDGI